MFIENGPDTRDKTARKQGRFVCPSNVTKKKGRSIPIKHVKKPIIYFNAVTNYLTLF